MNMRIGLAMFALVVFALVLSSSPSQGLQDAVTADSKHYTVEFENDIVRVLRVRLGAGDSTPRHAHSAYCAIELTDSSLKEGDGPTSESKAGQIFCGDALAHAPRNLGKPLPKASWWNSRIGKGPVEANSGTHSPKFLIGPLEFGGASLN